MLSSVVLKLERGSAVGDLHHRLSRRTKVHENGRIDFPDEHVLGLDVPMGPGRSVVVELLESVADIREYFQDSRLLYGLAPVQVLVDKVPEGAVLVERVEQPYLSANFSFRDVMVDQPKDGRVAESIVHLHLVICFRQLDKRGDDRTQINTIAIRSDYLPAQESGTGSS